MDYEQISGFLEKFKKVLFQKEEVYEIISDTIFQQTKILIKKDLIKIRNNFIYIECSPILKNEILIYKSKILLSLKNKTPNNLFIDIK
ncbi:MAG: hypothetical protein PHT84_01635 [Candidatus Pacebacteria bacterium]|jgi:hypothetical protein|nr:hypothetical protein [Candidatus Paceibacterota bacterium]